MNMRVCMLVMLSFLLSLPLSAETLIKATGEGRYEGVLAASWESDQNGVLSFRLLRPVAESVAETLAKSDMGLTVKAESAEVISISGLPVEQLLERLSSIECYEAKEDVFDGMEALAASDLAVPDGSSSLRVRKRDKNDEELAKQFTARVLRVEKSECFPIARVFVKIISPPEKPLPDVRLKEGDEVWLRPFFANKKALPVNGGFNDLDFTTWQSRANVGIWFLQPGDGVTGRASISKSGETHVFSLLRNPD